MATHTTAHYHIGNTLVPQGWGRRIGAVAAGLAIAGTVAVTTPWSDSHPDGRTASTATTAWTEQSVLLDGEAFDIAIADVVADAQGPSIVDRPAEFLAETEAAAAAVAPRSALLDAEAFEAAVAAVVATMDPPRSALLEGEAFHEVVSIVVAELGSTESALLDGEAFEIAVAQAVDSVLGS